jgi:hypothetical protein
MDQAALFQLVPVGEENAVSALMIWKSHRIGGGSVDKAGAESDGSSRLD